MMVIVYCDIDGVLRDLIGAVDRLYMERFPGEIPVNVTVYDMMARYPLWGEDGWDIVFREQVNRIFNHDAMPYQMAVETLQWLATQDNVMVKLLSKQDALRKPLTDDWLDRMGIPDNIERIYIDGISKGEYLLNNPSDFPAVMFDDSPEEIESLEQTDVMPVLVRRVWNEEFQRVFDKTRINQLTVGVLLIVLPRLDEISL